MKEKLVPELRFKEFDTPWFLNKLSDWGDTVNGLTYSPSDIDDNGVIVLRSSNIKNGQLSFLDVVKVKTVKYNPVQKNDILICVRNGSTRLIGKNAIIPEQYKGLAFGAFMSVFRSDINSFIQFLFATSRYKKMIQADLGARINSINNNNLKRYKFYFPSLPEQQKIADFLTSVDQKIQALTRKIDLLKDYKKGVMQKVFKQEIRFRPVQTEASGDDDGGEFPDWEEKKLGEIAKKSKDKNRDDSHSHVFTNSATQGIVNQREYFDKDIANQGNLEGYYIVKPDDLVYNPRISNHAPVGPMFRNKLSVTGLMSPLYSVFTVSNGNLVYLDYFFSSTMWHKYMRAVANYGARHDRMNVTNDDLMKMPIAFPCIEEQTKIANFLTSIDDKISAVEGKLEKMKEWKKGLLQKMFV